LKILVLGGSGMWGHQAFLNLAEHFGRENVACTIRQNKSFYDTIEIFKNANVFENVDFNDYAKASACLKIFKPNIIVNCIGLTPRKYDTKDVDLYTRINTLLPQLLATWAQENNAKLIHFSTDCVFSGKKGNYTEADRPDAEDVYGLSKARGEVRGPNVLTYRLSKNRARNYG
jgi:dTDP-4-dehydrorhamnose reductase